MFRTKDLLQAIEKNDLLKVSALLENGINPNGLYEGPHPLTFAIQLGHLDIIELLVLNKACPTVEFKKTSLNLDPAAQARIRTSLTQSSRHTQSWILSKLDYLSPHTLKVCCNAFALMALNAVLSKDVKLFSERNKYLYEVSDSDFKKDMEQMEQMEPNGDNEILNSIQPFYNGLMLAQQPLLFPDLLDEATKTKLDIMSTQASQQAQPLLNLITPLKIEQQGGYHLSCRFSGMYKTEDMTIYLKILQKALQKINCPTGIIIRNEKHTILINTAKETKSAWQLVDVGEIPVIKNIVNTVEMAKKIVFNLERGGSILAGFTEVYCTKNNREMVDTAMKSWLNHPEMKKIHTLTQARLDLTTEDNIKWQDIVHFSGDTNLVHMMSNQPADNMKKKLLQNEKIVAGIVFLLLSFTYLQNLLNTQENKSLSSMIINMYAFFIPIGLYAFFTKYRQYRLTQKFQHAQVVTDLNPASIQYEYTHFDKEPAIKKHHNFLLFANKNDIKGQTTEVLNKSRAILVPQN